MSLSARIPFTVRDKNTKINSINGLNFDDTEINRLIKKIDETNAGNSNISNLHTATGSKTTFLSGDPDDVFTVIGGVIETDTVGINREMKLSVTVDHTLKITDNNPIGVTGGFNCLDSDVNIITGDLNALVGTVKAQNIIGTGGLTGTLVTVAQPNITSVGTLTALNSSGNITTTTGTVTAQDVTATGNLAGTLTTDEQPNIRRIAERLSFLNQGTGEKLVLVDNNTAFWIVNSHALSSGVTYFNYIGQPRVNYISGTTEFTDNAYFLGEINGTLATTAQPNITSVGTLTSLTSSGNITTTTGTVSAQNVTATGVLTGTLASGAQPNITNIASRIDLSVANKIQVYNSTTLEVVNSHNTNTQTTFFNHPQGSSRVNYIRGTTDFTQDAHFLGLMYGTLGSGTQPNITTIASRLDLSQANRAIINNNTQFWIVNSHALSTGVTHFNYVGQTRVNYIRGTTEFSQTAYFPAGTPSDDRLKHNEQIITNGLSVLSQLTPKKYDKSQVIMAADYIGDISGEYTVESGLIAQELLETDISFVVKIPDDLEIDPYGVDYNSVFTYAIAGIKELDAIVTTQAATISTLEERLAALEAATSTSTSTTSTSTLEKRLAALEATSSTQLAISTLEATTISNQSTTISTLEKRLTALENK